jgi:hypothetical protein
VFFLVEVRDLRVGGGPMDAKNERRGRDGRGKERKTHILTKGCTESRDTNLGREVFTESDAVPTLAEGGECRDCGSAPSSVRGRKEGKRKRRRRTDSDDEGVEREPISLRANHCAIGRSIGAELRGKVDQYAGKEGEKGGGYERQKRRRCQTPGRHSRLRWRR